MLGGIEQKIKVAHFRLCHSRKPFVMAHPGETHEMVLDAFVQTLSFCGGVPRRVIIDTPETMVTCVSRSKDRVRRFFRTGGIHRLTPECRNGCADGSHAQGSF
ncbi:transposase family protein [Palleronia caenipelagi]|uniref:Transposase family protein n=1 Tax=Palleronia caenipelagi TaxID=2489174 RepID=A0A547Q8Y4_9RHOB|nr:transposase family protein [Palleronia caenipelagi]TRD22814.1 transposase family protein [Palleronia caenipelagi]